MNGLSQIDTLSVLPLKNAACFPGLAMPITVQGRAAAFTAKDAKEAIVDL